MTHIAPRIHSSRVDNDNLIVISTAKVKTGWYMARVINCIIEGHDKTDDMPRGYGNSRHAAIVDLRMKINEAPNGKL